MLLFLIQKQTWFMVFICTFLQIIAFLAFACIGRADQSAEQANAAEIWDEIFTQRNDDEWRQLWHVEKHRRCYQDLENHMKWVCEKDIYKINKKRDGELIRFENCPRTELT